MDDREELAALRRMAELEAKAGTRQTPKQMKIGAEGFSDAMTDVMRSKGFLERNLAGVGAIPRQLYEGAKQIVGKGDPTAIRATRVMEQEAPVGAIAGGLSLAALAPQSVLGQAAVGGGMGALQPTEGNESRTKNALLGLTVAGGAAGAMKGLGMGANALLSRSAAKVGDTVAENAVRDATLKEGRSIGLVVPGSATGERGVARKALESVGGKAALGQEASIRNQEVVNHVARIEAGLSPKEPITEKSLELAREKLAAPYREIAAVSKKAKQALEDMRAARAEAKLYHREYNSTQMVSALKKAESLDTKAEAAEKVIESEAIAFAKKTYGMRGPKAQEITDNLLKSFKDARVKLAKNYQVERALNLGNGNVDAAAIGKMYDKVGEKGMTGGLATIGRFQQAFPDFMRAKPSTQIGPGIGALKPYAVALGLAAGANEPHAQHSGISPYMLGAAGLALAGGPARSIALSKLMQGAPTYAPGMSVRLADMATNNPALRSMIPLSAAGATLGGSNTQ